MKPILEIKNISKKFRINNQRKPYLSIRDSLADAFKTNNAEKTDFWALNDVSFDINPGDSVGVVGRNGAGKSTLLKILSKITPPTSGKIICRGRIASLLEVGTGFHPELTGRENVFLNGSILGLKKNEINKQFDAIVDFSGVEKFLDTPLKHYSSGMQLRLAFAVAAHLEPEILIIDEVLAVGDTEFQKKCVNKMNDVSKSGRTVLFVSHNMSAIKSLCTKGLYLKKGEVQSYGTIDKIIQDYTNSYNEATESLTEYTGAGIMKKIKVYCDGDLAQSLYMGCNLKIEVTFEAKELIHYPVLGLIIKDAQGTPLVGINNKHYVGNFANNPIKRGTITMEIPKLNLFQGLYSFDVRLGDHYTELEILNDVLMFEVDSKSLSSEAIDMPFKELNKFYFEKISWRLD